MLFSERVVPAADEVARAVIATCMMEPGAAEEAVERLTPDDFREAAGNGDFWADLFTAIRSLVEQGRRPAPLLVNEELKRLRIGPRNLDGSADDVSEKLLHTARTYNAGVRMDEYVRIMARYGLRRRIRMAGHKLIDLASDDGLETEEYAAQAETLMTEATMKAGETGDLIDLGTETLRRIQEHMERPKGEYPGLRTGFRDLDVSLRGLQPGDLIILAARPSMGKSALAQDIGANVAMKGKAVLFVSREMSRNQMTDRAIAAEGGVNASMLRGALLGMERLEDARKKVEQSGLAGATFKLDLLSKTVPDIRKRAMRMKRQFGLDMIIIDYLQLLQGAGKYARSGNRVQEVGEISRGLKQLATELQVPIIALSQLSRAVEQREDKKPILSDLRDSGDVEQDADVVAFLYRPGYYTKDPNDHSANVIIAKNRNGPLGTVELEFVAERVKFLDAQRRVS